MAPYERRVGFVFQDLALWPHLRAIDQVHLVGRPAGLTRADAQALLESVGLDGLDRRRPGQLSGGEQQRLAIACALAGNRRSCCSTNRNRNQGEIASAKATRAGAEATVAAVQLTAQAELAAAQARDDYARRAMAVYVAEARSLARQNLDVVTQTYELGRATVFDVLNEQRRYLDLERAYTVALREAYEARTALRRALGVVR